MRVLVSVNACVTVCVNGSLRAAPQSTESLCSSIISTASAVAPRKSLALTLRGISKVRYDGFTLLSIPTEVYPSIINQN